MILNALENLMKASLCAAAVPLVALTDVALMPADAESGAPAFPRTREFAAGVGEYFKKAVLP